MVQKARGRFSKKASDQMTTPQPGPRHDSLGGDVDLHVKKLQLEYRGEEITFAYLAGTAYEIAFIIKWLRSVAWPHEPQRVFDLPSLSDAQIGIAVRYYLGHVLEIEEQIKHLERIQDTPSLPPKEGSEEFSQAVEEIRTRFHKQARG